MAETLLSQTIKVESERIRGEIRASNRSGRNFDYYCRVFGYSPESLKGKLMLDIGAGDSNFAEVASRDCGAKVTRIDPKYSEIAPSFENDAFADVAQNMCRFKSESFDEVISMYGIYWIVTGRTEALQEMIRVTKPNGKIRLCPVWAHDRDLTATLGIFKDNSMIALSETEPPFPREVALTINKLPNYSNSWDLLVREVSSHLKVWRKR